MERNQWDSGNPRSPRNNGGGWSRGNFNVGAGEGSNRTISRFAGTRRRGHSDGLFANIPDLPFSIPPADRELRSEETLMDFLRQSSGTEQGDQGRRQLAATRAAIIEVDRKRRLRTQREDLMRRRSSGTISENANINARLRQSLPPLPHENISAPSRHPHVNSSVSSSSSAGSQHDMANPLWSFPSDISNGSASRTHTPTITRWQPDDEVQCCPVCHNPFNWWYRKHHCRKCGRVVCNSCSPHRITIPRQYIIKSPEQANADLNGNPSIAPSIIDLTGGEEVRLCNPCVPDPNLSPHLTCNPTMPIPNPPSSELFEPQNRPQSTRRDQTSIIPGLTRPAPGGLPNLPSRTSSVHSRMPPNYPRPTLSPSEPSTARSFLPPTDRRYGHAPRPSSSERAALLRSFNESSNGDEVRFYISI